MAEKDRKYNYSISAATNPASIEKTAQVARIVSEKSGQPVNVLVYSFVNELPTGVRQIVSAVGYNPRPVTAEGTVTASVNNGVQVSGIHGEFYYDEADLETQVQHQPGKGWKRLAAQMRAKYIWPAVQGFAKRRRALDFAEDVNNLQRARSSEPITPYIGYHWNVIKKIVDDDGFMEDIEASGLPLGIETAGYVPNKASDALLAKDLLNRFSRSGIIFAADHAEKVPNYKEEEFTNRISVVHLDPHSVQLASRGDADSLAMYKPLAEGVLLPNTDYVIEPRGIRFNKLSVRQQAARHIKTIKDLESLRSKSA